MLRIIISFTFTFCNKILLQLLSLYKNWRITHKKSDYSFNEKNVRKKYKEPSPAAYSEPCQTSKMKRSQKNSILDVFLGSEYASDDKAISNLGASAGNFLTFFKEDYKRLQNFLFSIMIGSFLNKFAQPTITCAKLTIETLEQGVKYVQS